MQHKRVCSDHGEMLCIWAGYAIGVKQAAAANVNGNRMPVER